MWLRLLLLSLVVACRNAGEPVFKVISVNVENNEQLQVLEELKKNAEIQFWTENDHSLGVAMFSVPESIHQSVINKLQEAGMYPETVIDDLQGAITKEKNENQPSLMERRGLQSFHHNRYLTIYEIYSYLESISNERSNLVKLVNLGSSYENKPISGVKITSGESGIKPVVFIECGIHAREWVSPASCLYMIDQLSRSDIDDFKELIEKYEWYIVPSSNPDGYLYTWSGDTRSRIWRKTRSRSGKSRYCVGADANRNFDSNFGGVGTSDNPCSDIYSGDFAFSEKESRALRDIILQLGSRIKLYFSIHSYSQFWMYPFGYSDKPAPNADELHKVSKTAVDAIEAVHGTQFTYGSIPDVIYKASGSSVDWVYDNIGTKYAFALELRDTGKYGFMLPKDQIVPTGEETLAGIVAAVNAV